MSIGTILSAISSYFKYGLDTPMFHVGEMVTVKQQFYTSDKVGEYTDTITRVNRVKDYYEYGISSYPKLTFYETKDEGGRRLIPVCDKYYSNIPYYIGVHKQEEEEC